MTELPLRCHAGAQSSRLFGDTGGSRSTLDFEPLPRVLKPVTGDLEDHFIVVSGYGEPGESRTNALDDFSANRDPRSSLFQPLLYWG
jgi:hypothetical protein